MSGQEEKKQLKEDDELRHFNQRDNIVGAIHILSNMKEDDNIRTWEISAIELSIQLLLRELDWIDGKIEKPEGFDDEEDEDTPIRISAGVQIGVEGIVKAVEQQEVYGYA